MGKPADSVPSKKTMGFSGEISPTNPSNGMIFTVFFDLDGCKNYLDFVEKQDNVTDSMNGNFMRSNFISDPNDFPMKNPCLVKRLPPN